MEGLVCCWTALRRLQSGPNWCSTGTSPMGWECREESSMITVQLHLLFITCSSLFLRAAGGSSLLVWKHKRLRYHPGHHAGERAAACHHAFPCAGWASAGPGPAGLANVLAQLNSQLRSATQINSTYSIIHSDVSWSDILKVWLYT